MEFSGDSPWKNREELYATIDKIQHGALPWKIYQFRYQGPLRPGTPPKWMTKYYNLCIRNSHQVLLQQLGSSHFKDSMNLSPHHQFDGTGQCAWLNLMSGDWAWNQAVYGIVST